MFCLHQTNFKNIKKQSGFSLLLAVFMITTMMMLASALSESNNDIALSTTWETLGRKAQLAAKTGIERVAYETLNTEIISDCTQGDKIREMSFDVNGLKGCSVEIYCKSDKEVVEKDLKEFYHFEAIGTCGSGQYEVERKEMVHIRKSITQSN